MGNGIKAYWYRDIVNFGDLITPLLLKHYGFTPIHTMPHKTGLVSAGSILEHLPEDYAGAILGSGLIYEESRMSFPRANILGVRGQLTHERIGMGHRDVALGDPGLLASRILQRREEKKYLLGIVPHHVEFGAPHLRKIAGKYPADIVVIDVRQQPVEVFRSIDQCTHILSSSLHGLIVADSLGIPTGWLAAGGLTGGNFKFHDYYSSLDIPTGRQHSITGEETVEELVAMVSLKPADRILELQDALHRQWSSLRQIL